jgi:hypothetical protein
MSNVFYVSVHSDPKIYTNQYKKVISNHSLYVQTNRGRKSGRTFPASFIINKISEALMDCGAVPLKDIGPRSKYSARPATFFVTQLEPYWEEAITDLAKIGVRIYVLPVMGPFDGMPDAVADSFDAYYTEKLTRYLSLAKKGSDVRDLVEVAVALSKLFEPASIALSDRHKVIVDAINEVCSDGHKDAAAKVASIGVAPTPTAAPESVNENLKEKPTTTHVDLNIADDF